jgi:peptidoglycan hydrolase-like protein with peptidoglycan-binding domain
VLGADGLVSFIPSVTNHGRDFSCVLGPGSQGAGVFVLQDALRRCYGQNIAQDAVYGEATRQAVINVQAFHGLPRDGAYGPDTRSRMVFAKFFEGGGEFASCWR